jgi:diaminobutyrate-2-oxoglutarate transaminase
MNELSLSNVIKSNLLESQAQRESNARTYPRNIPIAIAEAEGIYIKDTEGKSYIDCLAGAGTLALGHNHPTVIEAIQKVIEKKIPLHTLDLTTPIKEEFVDTLFGVLPAELTKNARIQFCGPSGADAVEAALKLVKTATDRRTILSFHGGYHGMTHGALSLTGNLNPKKKVANLMPDVHFLPYPYNYRCPFGLGGEAGHQMSSRYIEHLLNDPESGILQPAGMIMEVVQGEGGAIPAPNQWVKEIRRITREQQIPFMIDEVQAGIGRTGKMFAFEHAEIIPDVVILSKAIGGGLPISVVVYKKELDKWAPGAHTGTFRGNQLAMATGTATLKFIEENNLVQQATTLGDLLQNHLRQIQAMVESIGEVRGRGLMIGVEIVDKKSTPDSRGTYKAHPKLARQIQQECIKRGLILELGGRHGSVVRFLPPLIITAEEIHIISEIFLDAIRSAEKKLKQELVAGVN